MSTDNAPHNPYTSDEPSSDEYAFDRDRDPLKESDSAQAEASEYGRYGYIDHPGDETAEETTYTRASDDEAQAEAEEAESAPPAGVSEQEGGTQEMDDTGVRDKESRHGAGFDQPMEGPQRQVNSQRPKGAGPRERRES